MGAELIGWHAKGPTTLGGDDRLKAVAAAAEIRRITQIVLKTFQQRRDAQTDEEEAKFPFPAVARNVDFLVEAWDNEEERLMRRIAEMDVAGFVDTFIRWWNNGHQSYDTNSRWDPDDNDKVLVFAGASSWGDEPDGEGYTMLRDADRLGVLAACNIF